MSIRTPPGSAFRRRPGKSSRRTWLDVSGKHAVEAEYVETAGEFVRVRKTDGKMVRIKLEALSEPDRKWIEDWA